VKILVFQHAASEHPGSFGEVMRARGVAWDAVELDEGERIPDLAGYDALLVMGGPMDVWETDAHPWLVEEMAAIRRWVAAGRPYLGVCLGHQLLASAFGGHVATMEQGPEVGILRVAVEDDPLFAGIAPVCTSFEWHNAEVKRLPEGAKLLARGAHCPVQAMKLGQNAYGIQFHMELMHHTAEAWAEMPEYRAGLERARGSLAEVQAEVTAHFEPLYAHATQLFGNFLTIAETGRNVST
jgi:GMP synthase-like glutamine amidotransferase